MDAPVRRCEKIDLPRWSRGRLRKRWSKVISHNLHTSGLADDMIRTGTHRILGLRWQTLANLILALSLDPQGT